MSLESIEAEIREQASNRLKEKIRQATNSIKDVITENEYDITFNDTNGSPVTVSNLDALNAILVGEYFRRRLSAEDKAVNDFIRKINSLP